MDSVPHLDQRQWNLGDEAQRAAFARSFRTGLESTGFVTLEGHDIDPAAIARAYAAFAEFFALPEERKLRYGGVAGGARGFTGFGIEHAKDQPSPDLKEFFHVGPELPSGHPRASQLPPNCWPAEVPELRRVLPALFAALEQCAGHLLEALAHAYSLPGSTFSQMLRGGNSLLRAAHYPPLGVDSPPGSLRAAAHEDINLITLLCEATDSGLEILTESGWLPVACSPGEIVVDAGDMLSQRTGGAIPSTTHRVVNPKPGSEAATRARYSIPFFAHPRRECDLSVHPHFATPERVRAFPPITAGAFLDLRLREIGLAEQDA